MLKSFESGKRRSTANRYPKAYQLFEIFEYQPLERRKEMETISERDVVPLRQAYLDATEKVSNGPPIARNPIGIENCE